LVAGPWPRPRTSGASSLLMVITGQQYPTSESFAFLLSGCRSRVSVMSSDNNTQPPKVSHSYCRAAGPECPSCHRTTIPNLRKFRIPIVGLPVPSARHVIGQQYPTSESFAFLLSGCRCIRSEIRVFEKRGVWVLLLLLLSYLYERLKLFVSSRIHIE